MGGYPHPTEHSLTFTTKALQLTKIRSTPRTWILLLVFGLSLAGQAKASLRCQYSFYNANPFSEVDQRTQQSLANHFQIQNFKLSDIKINRRGRSLGNISSKIQWVFKFRNNILGTAWINLIDDVLRFDLEISEKRRGLGLYYFMLAQALQTYPDTKAIPIYSGRPGSRAENASIYRDIFEGHEDSTQFFPSPDSQESFTANIRFRNLLIETYAQTPAAKARAYFGFQNLTKIGYQRDRQAFAAYVENGQPSSPEEIHVYYSTENTSFKILPDGNTETVSLKEAIDLGPYNKMSFYHDLIGAN